MTGFTIAALASAFGFGFRHGIDWDHLAAIGDIASSSGSRRRAFALSTVYALAHAAVVIVLGAILILADVQIAGAVDRWFGYAVGLTLVVLGGWVIADIVRHRGGEYRLRSRWMLMFGGIPRGIRKVRRSRLGRSIGLDHQHSHQHTSVDANPPHDHGHEAGDDHITLEAPIALNAVVTGGCPAASSDEGDRSSVFSGHRHRHAHHHELLLSDDPFVGYGAKSAAGIGLIHGVGVETPTQIAIFVATTQATGRASATALLVTWVVGLLLANTVIAAVATMGMNGFATNRRVHAVVGTVVGLSSIVLGVMLLFGGDTVLPELL